MTCSGHADRALQLSSLLLDLANEERDECDHDGCLLLDGIIRDCALQIQQSANRQRLELTPDLLRAPNAWQAWKE